MNMKKILFISLFVISAISAFAQPGYFRPSYIGWPIDTHEIHVLAMDTVSKRGAWLSIDSLTTLVGSAGVSGLADKQVLFGGPAGLIDQDAGLTYDDALDSLVIDSTLTINGVSGLTPTTVKVLKDGLLEWDGDFGSTPLSERVIWAARSPQKNEGSNDFLLSVHSANYGEDRNNQSWFIGLGEQDDTTSMGFQFEDHYLGTHELHLILRDSSGATYRPWTWGLDKSTDHSNWTLQNYVGQFRIHDPDVVPSGNDGLYASLGQESGVSSYIRLLGGDASTGGGADGIEMLVNTTSDQFDIKPFGSMPSTAGMYTSQFGFNYVNRLGIQTDWGTFLGSNGNPVYLYGGESLYGGVVRVPWSEAADSIANHITFPDPGGGVDSIVTCWNGDIGFVINGDTTCVDQDSFYVIEPCTYFIIMNDTVAVCIPEGTPGQNIGNSNLSTTNTPGGLRTFNIDTVNFHIRRGTSNRFTINNDQSTSIADIRGGSGTTKPQLKLQNINLETGGAGLHFNGLTDGTHVRDYSIWMNPGGTGSFNMYEQSTPGDPFFTYWGLEDSIVIPKMIQFNNKVLDEDGDTGTTGQVLVATASGTVNWAAGGAGANGIYSEANNGEIWESDSTYINDSIVIYGIADSSYFKILTGETQTTDHAVLQMSNDGISLYTDDNAVVHDEIRIGLGTGLDAIARSGIILSSLSDGYYFNTEPVHGDVGDHVMAYDSVTGKWSYLRQDELPGGAGGPIPINDLQAADGTNTIDNAALAQEWQWNSLASGTGLKLSSNSTAAASNTHKLLGLSLTGVNATSTQTTYGLHVEHAKTGTLGTNIAGYFESLTGIVSYGVFGNVDDGFAVYGNATSGVGAYGSATSGTGILGSVTTGLAGYLISNPATTNSVINSFDIHRNSSGGAGANGIGSQFRFLHETSTTVSTEASTIASLWTDATHATRTSALDFYTVNSASLARKMRIAGNGQITADTYGDGTHTVTATTRPVFDANGVMGEENGYAVLAVGHPAESKTNDVTTEQDYTSIYTIPANYLTENRVIRVTLGYQFTTGTNNITAIHNIELGGTKVFTLYTVNYVDATTRTLSAQFLIQGTAAPGASVDVETQMAASLNTTLGMNTVVQPVALPTNGALTIVPTIQYSATGSTETMQLRTFLVEQLN